MKHHHWTRWGLLIIAVASPSIALGQDTGSVLRIPDCRLSLFAKASLASERSGIIDRVEVVEGDRVEAGDRVAHLKDYAVRAALATSEKQAENDIDLRFAKKAVELATLELSKSIKVNEFAAGTIAEIELRRLRLAAEKSLLQVEQAEHQVEVLQLQRDEKRAALAMCTIAAPWSGVVLRVLKRPGEGVREGESVLEIVDLNRLRAEVYVPLTEAWQIRVGQDVRFKPAQSDGASSTTRVFSGHVVHMEPRVDPVTQKVRIWAEIQNQDDRLMDGLQGELFVRTSTIEQDQAAGLIRPTSGTRPARP